MADANKVKPIALRDLSPMPQSEWHYTQGITRMKYVGEPMVWENEGILAEIAELTENND